MESKEARELFKKFPKGIQRIIRSDLREAFNHRVETFKRILRM